MDFRRNRNKRKKSSLNAFKKNSEALSEFVNSHFYEDTFFVHDSQSGYNFLINDINYTNKVHSQGEGDF